MTYKSHKSSKLLISPPPRLISPQPSIKFSRWVISLPVGNCLPVGKQFAGGYASCSYIANNIMSLQSLFLRNTGGDAKDANVEVQDVQRFQQHVCVWGALPCVNLSFVQNVI